MDELVTRAHAARDRIDQVERAARMDYYRACADVVVDERRRGDNHGAQARAAVRLGLKPQYLGRILKLIN